MEREVVDLYRVLYMRDRIGDVLEGTISAMVGSGVFVTLQEPFVDVLVRYDALGPDRYELDDDELSVVGLHNGDTLQLGDPLLVEIEDVAVLRRMTYARRVPPDKVVRAAGKGIKARGRGRKGRPEQARGRKAPPKAEDRKKQGKKRPRLQRATGQKRRR